MHTRYDGLNGASAHPPVHADDGVQGDGATGEPVLFTPEVLRAVVERLRVEVGLAIHAVNNPLTVITGNAQFLREMAGAMALDPLVTRSVEDIEEAGQELNAALARLSAVRQALADTLGTSDAL